MTTPASTDLDSLVAFVKTSLPYVLTPEAKHAAASIAFNPFFWNFVGRTEFKSQIYTKIAGNKYRACYVFAAIVFTLGLFRDYLYYEALKTQPVSPLLDNSFVKLSGIISAGVGHILVISSMWALGITGTYLGDHFRIFMKAKVTSFPFNVCNNPMYVGSSLTFLGVALHEAKSLGSALSAFVWTIYWFGSRFEEPFTAKIYSSRERKQE